MEMTRIKIIEDENLRFNQTIDKSNRGMYNCTYKYLLVHTLCYILEKKSQINTR